MSPLVSSTNSRAWPRNGIWRRLPVQTRASRDQALAADTCGADIADLAAGWVSPVRPSLRRPSARPTRRRSRLRRCSSRNRCRGRRAGRSVRRSRSLRTGVITFEVDCCAGVFLPLARTRSRRSREARFGMAEVLPQHLRRDLKLQDGLGLAAVAGMSAYSPTVIRRRCCDCRRSPCRMMADQSRRQDSAHNPPRRATRGRASRTQPEGR
jgi:hypothetical protein